MRSIRGWVIKKANNPNLQNFENERVISSDKKNFLGTKNACKVAL
jgi:hypothetical protein